MKPRSKISPPPDDMPNLGGAYVRLPTGEIVPEGTSHRPSKRRAPQRGMDATDQPADTVETPLTIEHQE